MKKLIMGLAVLFSSSALYSMEKSKQAVHANNIHELLGFLLRVEDTQPPKEPTRVYKALTDEESARMFQGVGQAAPLSLSALSGNNNGASSTSESILASLPDLGIAQVAPVFVSPYPKCYFSHDIKAAFLNCIDNENTGVRGTWFRFTLYDAAQAIVKGMKERKINAKLIVDKTQISDDFCSPLKMIINNGGTVCKIDENKTRFPGNGKFETLHLKCMEFLNNANGKKLLWTGSWNATGQASLKNWENAVIIDDPQAIMAYEAEFALAEQYSVALTPAQCANAKDADRNVNFARRMNGIPELN